MLTRLAGLASDGTQIMVMNSIASDPSEPEDPRGMALMTRDPATGKTEEIARHGTAERWLQLPGVTVSGDKVVWIETPSTSLYELPWELYTYDLRTRKEEHLASSDFFGIENPPQPWLEGIVPIIEGRFAYFPAVDEVRESDPDGFGRASVYRVPLMGGDPELVAKGAIEVFSDVDGMLQMRFPKRISQWDPSKGSDGEVPGTSIPAAHGSFANEGVRVTFNQGDGVRIQKADQSEVAIDVGDESAIGYLNATSRWVSFTVDAGGKQQGYIYDLERDKLMKLKGVINSSSTRLSGNVNDLGITWRKQPPELKPLIELLPAG